MLDEHEYQIKQILSPSGGGRLLTFAVCLPAPNPKSVDLILGKFEYLKQATKYRSQIEKENS